MKQAGKLALLALALAMVLALSGCVVHKAPPPAEAQTPPDTLDDGHDRDEDLADEVDYPTYPLNKNEAGAYAIETAHFVEQLNEIGVNMGDYLNQMIQLEGYVYHLHDVSHVQFSVLRDYLEGDYEDVVGLDCYYEGDLPADGAWVRVTGVLTLHLDEEENVYPVLMVQDLATVDEPEGARQVSPVE